MNRRNTVVLLAVVICLASLWAVLAQRQQIAGLRAEQQRVLALVAQTPDDPAAASQTGQAPGDSGNAPATADVSPELLRLRSEVNRLTTRKRELAGVAAEAERLRAEAASRATNAPAGTPLPPGYIRKADAQWVGCATPENTIQSFLSALRTHNLTNLLQTLTPATAEKLATQMQKAGRPDEAFFKDTDVLPGLGIRSREQLPDGTMQFEMEVAPGVPAEKIAIQLINGEWKLAMPF